MPLPLPYIIDATDVRGNFDAIATAWPGRGPHCEVTRVIAAQAIANGVATAIIWDTAIENTFGMWAVGAPTIVTIPRTGRYMVEANVEWAPEPTAGPHGLWIQPSTTSNAAPRDVGQYETVAAGFQHLPSAGAPMFLPKGTTLTVYVSKATGAGALNCGGPPAVLFGMGTNMRVSWLGE